MIGYVLKIWRKFVERQKKEKARLAIIERCETKIFGSRSFILELTKSTRHRVERRMQNQPIKLTKDIVRTSL